MGEPCDVQTDASDFADRLNRLLCVPSGKLDFGDGRELIVQKWSPSLSIESPLTVTVRIEGVVLVKEDLNG